MIDRQWILDLGMHDGQDTAFYLAKGFAVVAVEANPVMVARGRERFSSEIAAGELHLVDRALWHEAGATIPFYVNPVKDDWSSAFRDWAEKGGHRSQSVDVGTVTLGCLFDRFGTPRYVKCDVEGADMLFARQLLAESRRPAFVSVEAASAGLLSLVHAAGYDRLQIVNQALLPWRPDAQPQREGRPVQTRFTTQMSGPFGLDLDPAGWIGIDEAMARLVAFQELGRRDPDLAHGWLDAHFAASGTLQGA